MKQRRAAWDANAVKDLRRHLQLTQDELAEELGVRQQTVSEWETGVYRPRGASGTLLTIVADRAGFAYGVGDGAGTENDPAGGGGVDADDN
jgi:DNA-binding transcriptional regulator YiaG